MTKPRDPKSAYARQNKRPFQYSEYYQRWARALADHGINGEDTLAADAAFRRVFNVPTPKAVRR